MKRLFWSCSIVLIGTFLAPYSSFALMHISNSNLRFECGDCHPGGPSLGYIPCADCHNNSSGGGYTDFNTIEMPTHMDRDCLDCHDNHEPNGISSGILNEDHVLADFTANRARTDYVNQTTTFESMTNVTIHDPEWADPATWGEKTSPERGLLFVMKIRTKYYWFEVISATDTTITIGNASVYFPQWWIDNPFPVQLIYGMLIRDEVNGNSVIFSGPKTMANDESGTGFDETPDGICQVCHTQTLHWRNDGSLANHFSGQNCIMCHPHEQGFKAVSSSLTLCQ